MTNKNCHLTWASEVTSSIKTSESVTLCSSNLSAARERQPAFVNWSKPNSWTSEHCPALLPHALPHPSELPLLLSRYTRQRPASSLTLFFPSNTRTQQISPALTIKYIENLTPSLHLCSCHPGPSYFYHSPGILKQLLKVSSCFTLVRVEGSFHPPPEWSFWN